MKLLGMREVREKLPVSATRIYQLINAGDFPRPQHIGSRSFWEEADVDAAIKALLASANGKHPTTAEVPDETGVPA